MQGTVIDSSTAINVGVLIAVIGGVIRITILFTQIRAQLDLHKDTPAAVQNIKGEIAGLKSDISATKGSIRDLEDDVNNLWAFAVSDDPARLFGRLRRGPRSKGRATHEGDEP